MKTTKHGDTVLKWYGEDIKRALPEERKRALTAIGMAVQNIATFWVPVISGRLRDSIKYQVDSQGNEVEIGTNVVYARKVEYRKPYLRRGLDESRNFINNQLQMAVKRSMAKGGR